MDVYACPKLGEWVMDMLGIHLCGVMENIIQNECTVLHAAAIQISEYSGNIY